MAIIFKSMRTLVSEAIANNTYSPDVSQMQHLFDTVPVFVTGTEKVKCFEHKDVLDGHDPVGFGYTAKPSYVLHLHKKTRLPVVMYNPAHPGAAYVYGELYKLPVRSLLALDDFHQNGVYTKRGWRPVEVYHRNDAGNQTKTYHQIDAIMYTGNIREISSNDFDEANVVQAPRPYYMWNIQMDADAEKTGPVPF